MNKITYDELEEIVYEYQHGSKSAAEQLLFYYESYIEKHVNAIKGRFNMADKTQRNFVRLFIQRTEDKQSVHLFRKSVRAQAILTRTAHDIQTGYRHIDEEDLRQTMVTLLLDMAYSHHGEVFHIYVARIFPRKLFKEIRGWKSRRDVIPFDETSHETSYEEPEIRAPKKGYRIRDTSDTDYNENWINGVDCEDIFEELSIYERRILKWYYEHKTIFKEELGVTEFERRRKELRRTEQDIADRLGCSRKTVNVKRNEAKRKIEQAAIALRLIKG